MTNDLTRLLRIAIRVGRHPISYAISFINGEAKKPKTFTLALGLDAMLAKRLSFIALDPPKTTSTTASLRALLLSRGLLVA